MIKTFNSRKPIKAELHIIHQYMNRNRTHNRTLNQIVKDVNDDKLILDLIHYGQACDHYHEWKNHTNKNIRLSLATNRYFLEQYIHDKSDQIKYTAISKQPELINKLLNEPANHELQFACEYLYIQPSPNINTLKKYLIAAHIESLDQPKNEKENALYIKYLAETCELNTINKTMTPTQLFIINHPAWAKKYYPEIIEIIQNVIKSLKYKGYNTKSDYAETLLAITDEYQNDEYYYYNENS